jgi:DNA repair exonuclease SbcCD ATPase subunit
MTLNISQLRERVARQFSDVEQVDDSIIRFTRKAGELPFAVCYLDVAQDIPRTQETLTKYQDRVIGSRYFEGGKSLQWNYYLYFVTSAARLHLSEVREARELIERDRSYARKFVISEEELDSVLTPPVVEPAEATPRANVLSTWTDLLAEAGLDRAILCDEDLPTRLALIESSPIKTTGRRKTPQRKVEVKTAPFIRSLRLSKFLDFPLQRGFEFGRVNLIFGVNGTGKTCLLEAIELFYCGRNKRNPDASSQYELAVVFEDGRTDTATANRKQQLFRDLNLVWYGQSEVKTNNLYLGFARFNYLDTDAAVSLAESTPRLEDDLSKLLVGPDASKTWRDIGRVYKDVSSKLRELDPLKIQAEDELGDVEKRLDQASRMQPESDSIRTRLEEMIHRLGWSVAQGDKEVFAGRLMQSVSELVSLAQQAAAFDWTESPVSIDGLAKYCYEASVSSKKAEPDLVRLELLREKQRRLANAIKRGREALDLARQAKRLVDAGVPDRAAERSKQQSAIATYSDWLAGLDAAALGVLPTDDMNMTVAVSHEAAVAKLTAAKASLASAKSEHANYSKLRDESLNLAQELRQIAAKILQTSPAPDECPLCHTRFGPGELAKHITLGVDEHLEAVGQTLLSRLREREGALREATAIEIALASLKKFCERASLASNVPVHSALAEVEKATRELAEAQARLKVLDAEVLAQDSQGLSVAKLEEISTRLDELGYPLAESSQQAVDGLLSTLNQDLESSSRTLEAERKQADALQHALQGTLGSAEAGVQELKGALSRLKERLVATESLQTKLGSFSSSFPWPSGRPLAELVVEAEAVRKVAADLQTALSKERQAQATYTESSERKGRLERQLAELRPRIERLAKAQSTLENLQRDHSLTSAMEEALQQNRTGIETIFSHIHSPVEFRGLGSSWSTLVRKADGSEAKLSQISAGQRAAFALSIFLAQNAQLTVAPPVVLMDDPIAHVDDLNSLSFLDYLREVVLGGRRQIFFATANHKLATLFERKFDFLGPEGFRRIDLTR